MQRALSRRNAVIAGQGGALGYLRKVSRSRHRYHTRQATEGPRGSISFRLPVEILRRRLPAILPVPYCRRPDQQNTHRGF